MTIRLRSSFGDYLICPRGEIPEEGELLSFGSVESARFFLLDWLGDSLVLMNLRSFLCDEGHRNSVCYLDDHALIDEVAKILCFGFTKVVRLPPHEPWLFYLPEEKKNEEQESEQDAKPTSWIRLKVVDDINDQPVMRARFDCNLPDGSKTIAATRSGQWEMSEIESGQVSLGCEFDGASLENTLAFVGMGDEATGEEEKHPDFPEPFRQPLPGSYIAKIEPHKVKTGEAREDLAAKANMSWESLAQFNWAQTDPKQVEQCLALFVGCSQKDQDGNHVFDDSDEPGIIYIPTPWQQSGLDTDREHTIRVRRIVPVLPILYQIDVDQPENKNDMVKLQAANLKWEHEIAAGELEEVRPNLVRLIFPLPTKDTQFHLIQDPSDGHRPTYVFQNFTIKKLLAAQSEEIEAIDPEPSEQEESSND